MRDSRCAPPTAPASLSTGSVCALEGRAQDLLEDEAVPKATPSMKPAPLEYLAAATPDDALVALARFEGNARLLAGGQSLVPLLTMRLLRPTAVIDINGISGLGRITAGGGVVRVGALVRYSTLESSPVVRERLPLLARPSRSSATGRFAIAAPSVARSAMPIRRARWRSAR